MPRLRILLADDHQMFIAGLKKLLDSHFEIVGCVRDGAALVREAERLQPAVVVADVGMPEMNGIEATRTLTQRSSVVRIVLLTMHDDPEMIEQAVSAGAAAYVLKRDAPDILIRAIRDAVRGIRSFPRPYSDATAAGKLPTDNAAQLSKRQLEIVRLISKGYAQKQIAAELHISPKTVEFHKYKMMRALGAQSTAQLVAMAFRNGWARA